MPPNKGGNSKKEAGRARKADNEVRYCRINSARGMSLIPQGQEAGRRQQGQGAEGGRDLEGRRWVAGTCRYIDALAKGTSKAEQEAAKKAEIAAKKAERDAQLAAEEASLPSKPKAAPKAKEKKKDAGSAFKTNAGVAAFRTDDPLGLRRGGDQVVPEFSAVGIDDALEALEIANAKTDDNTMGAKVSSSVVDIADFRRGSLKSTPRGASRRRSRHTWSASCQSSRTTYVLRMC